MKWAAALLLFACAEKPAPSTGLRVPLPEGWAATPRGGGLEVGPRGRVLVTLEIREGAVPTSAELSRAVAEEGARNVTREDGEGYAAVRYALGNHRDGFLAVKRASSKTVWCASTAQADLGEIDDGLALCKGIELQ